MFVKAVEGAQCPMEGKPREYITDTTPVDVEPTSYYQRLVAEGSLVVCPAAKVKKETGGDQ